MIFAELLGSFFGGCRDWFWFTFQGFPFALVYFFIKAFLYFMVAVIISLLLHSQPPLSRDRLSVCVHVVL